jgi:LysR family transcriptional regulator, nitrogen assimilation regulatory protein
MNRRQITYFLAVANAGSFSRAAERLRVAQPALSARIGELEADVGVRLFDRHPRGVRLTPHGMALLPHAEEIETAFARAAHALQSPVEDHGTIISIGVTPMVAVTILPAILDVTAIDGRPVEWHAQQAAALPLIELLVQGKIDSALIYYNPKRRDVRGIPLFHDDMAIIGPPSVLGQSGKDIRLADAARFKLVLDQKSHLTRHVIETAAAKKNIELNVVAEVEPLPAKRRFMQRGCCTINPPNAFATELQDGTYVARRIIGPRIPVTMYLLVCAKIDPARCKTILAAVRAGLAPMLQAAA